MASKIGLIIRREYLSRVQKKMFLFTTLGLPIIMFGLFALMGYLAASSSEKLKIAVVDESNIFKNKLWDSSSTKSFTYFEPTQLADLQKTYLAKDYNALVHIKAPINKVLDTNTVKVFSKGTLSLDASDYLDRRLNNVYRDQLMQDAGMSTKEIDSLNKVEVKFQNINEKNTNTKSELLAGIGYFNGFLLYMLMFIYGMMVMRGVMEEKTNRVAEVIISSVKPFDLMMGKIIGIGLVGITQFAIWIVFGSIISFIGLQFFGIQNTMPTGMDAAAQLAANKSSATMMSQIMQQLATVNWFKIIACFLIYFVGGFLLYAAQFAAVGSMVNEDVNEAQSLTLPITMPIIFGFFIMQMAIKDPNSGIAIFGSLFPLTSPLVMMARIAYDPPMWQVILSIVLLILSIWFFVWLSAKIYRTGILMYGKKPSWKEVWKWLRVKS